MKVIRVDNFDRGIYDDTLILDNLSNEQAEKLAQNLNDLDKRAACDWHFLVVADDYKLFVTEE